MFANSYIWKLTQHGDDDVDKVVFAIGANGMASCLPNLLLHRRRLRVVWFVEVRGEKIW